MSGGIKQSSILKPMKEDTVEMESIEVETTMHDMDRQHHHQGFDEEEIEEQVIVDDHQGGHQTMDEDYGDFLDVPYEDEEEEHEIYDEEDSNFPNQNNVNGPRAGKSLGRLTQRFIRYLQNAPTGMVDLNVAISYSRGGQLRKRGGGIDLKPGDERRIYSLKTELTELEREERLLDTHLRWMKQSIRNVCENQDNCKLAYTSQDDLLEVFPDSLTLALQAPPTSSIEVNSYTTGRMGYGEDHRNELKVNSRCGAAQVFVLNVKDESFANAIVRNQHQKQQQPIRPSSQNVYNNISDDPGNILENEPDVIDRPPDGQGNLSKKQDDNVQPRDGAVPYAEGFRVLTPPPSERDYLYGINKNDSILKLYEENYE